jgi:hypothetical protein
MWDSLHERPNITREAAGEKIRSVIEKIQQEFKGKIQALRDGEFLNWSFARRVC